MNSSEEIVDWVKMRTLQLISLSNSIAAPDTEGHRPRESHPIITTVRPISMPLIADNQNRGCHELSSGPHSEQGFANRSGSSTLPDNGELSHKWCHYPSAQSLASSPLNIAEFGCHALGLRLSLQNPHQNITAYSLLELLRTEFTAYYLCI